MNFSHIFISRPVLAAVLSIFLVLIGAISVFNLPIAQYPEIVPPTIQVKATYPGANSETVAETVAAPIEQEVNGVENMLYMSSQSANDGSMTLTITFALGTDLNSAQVLVQNRVSAAEPRLPQEVRDLGVTTVKQSPDLTMVVHLISPNKTYDQLYLSNYALLQLRDTLTRLPGVGDVKIFGARDYSMRIWLDPQKISSRNLTAGDVVAAIREQNVQVAAGIIGQPPVPKGTPYQLTVSTKGRLSTVDDFSNIIIKAGADGSITRLRDVARVVLGAQDNTMNSLLGGSPAVAMVIFQLPGTNSLSTSLAVRKAMEQMKERFPTDVDYRIVYDTTLFVRDSISSVIQTLFEAIGLVVIVVLIFLQTWRASLIPLVAVPVSIIGTFAVMNVLGFSLNNLSLFGLVLAIGIVVDDAIVVVENVERNLELGLDPVAATRKAMNEVIGPVISTALVLSSVFIPTAFISGLSGEFYRQFALTIAVSTIISAFNSLTLSPALCALLLRPPHARPDIIQILVNVLLGWFFFIFNSVFAFCTKIYVVLVRSFIYVTPVVLLVYGGLLYAAWVGFHLVPTGFIPAQDKGYLICVVALPDGAASLERTDAVVAKVSAIARKIPGVLNTVEFAGFSVVTGSTQPNSAAIFLPLKPFSERTSPDQSGFAIMKKLYGAVSGITDAYVLIFPPPPVNGLGSFGGFKLEVEERGGGDLKQLLSSVNQLIGQANQMPQLQRVFTSVQGNTPQLYLDVDRFKAKSIHVPLSSVFDTLNIYLGSVYVNDLTLFNRTYKVTAQADSQFRLTPDDIGNLKTRNDEGQMVPLSTLISVKQTTGPDHVVHYNMYPAADINGQVAPGYSTDQANEAIENLAKKLPADVGYDWTELTYQEIIAGNTSLYIFPLCVLFVFLTLAGQYESFSLPLAVILIVPMCLFSAIWGVYFMKMDNNIFTQIGFVVLVGLACKNAILIVEFARSRHHEGANRLTSALDAARLRIRPILMTSFSFILGVLPLVYARGAGAEMRQALGTAVFFGMIGVTLFGIFLTPVFYVTIRWITELGRTDTPPANPPAEKKVVEPRTVETHAETNGASHVPELVDAK